MTHEEFDEFFRSHWQPTRNYAVTLGCSHEQAEDIAQDLLLEIWRAGQRCALQTMVRQRLSKVRRKGPARQQGEFQSFEQTVPDVSWQLVAVNECLDSVSDGIDRQIVEMKYEGMTIADVARRLG